MGETNLSNKERAAYERAKNGHYVVVEAGQSTLATAYHAYCVSEQIYSVSVHFHAYAPGKLDECRIDEEHASVYYDFFHCRQGITQDVFQRIQECFERNRPGFYKDTPLSMNQVGGFGVVPGYTAEKVAQVLADLLDSPHSHSTEMFHTIYPHLRERTGQDSR